MFFKEDKTIGYNYGNTNYNQCVIMAGGCGVGKTYILEKFIGIEGKVFNVDDLKQKYIDLQKRGVIDDPEEYDILDPDSCTRLHKKIASSGLNDRLKDAFFNKKANLQMPNAVFDIAGKNEDDFKYCLKYVKPYLFNPNDTTGINYETTLVWVVANRSRAMMQNFKRERIVNQNTFHTYHNMINEFLTDFLPTPKAGEYFDHIYIVFNSMETQMDIQELTSKDIVCVPKVGGTFDFSKIMPRIEATLGDNEPNPQNPQKYMPFDNVKHNGYRNPARTVGGTYLQTDAFESYRRALRNQQRYLNEQRIKKIVNECIGNFLKRIL